MNKCKRKEKSGFWKVNKTFEEPEKDKQTAISKFLVKQENKQSNYRLPEVPLPVLNNDSEICYYTNLASPTSKTLKVPSECKENCAKCSKDYAEHTQDVSNTKNSTDQSKDSIKEKRSRKQMMLSQNRQLTDYFPVRRSNRKTLSSTKRERQNMVEDAVLLGKEEGFEIKEFPGKGRGVITKKPIKRGEFVLEYYGELIDYEEAKKREANYATAENTGCYMYYFKFRNKRFCIDATKETNRLGRLVNHSKKGNLKTQTFFIKECPHLVLLACRDIEPGEELSYDYGDRRKVAVQSHPWLAL